MCDPEVLGCYAFEVFRISLQYPFGYEKGKVGVPVPDLFDFSVEVFFDALPDGESIRHKDHESLGAGIVGQLSLGNNLSIPFGQILRLLYSDSEILATHWNIRPSC